MLYLCKYIPHIITNSNVKQVWEVMDFCDIRLGAWAFAFCFILASTLAAHSTPNDDKINVDTSKNNISYKYCCTKYFAYLTHPSCPLLETQCFYCRWLNLSHLWWIISCIFFLLVCRFFKSIFILDIFFKTVLIWCTPRFPNRSLNSQAKAIEEEMEQEYLSELTCKLCPKSHIYVTGMLVCEPFPDVSR